MKTIYLVEDDEHIAQIVAHFLKGLPYAVTHCPNVMEAGRKLRGATPDLIIMDLGLPDLSGSQFVKMLKSNEKYKAIPVMILTGQPKEAAQKASQESGAVALMMKPFTKAALIEQVTKLLPPEGPPSPPSGASAGQAPPSTSGVVPPPAGA